MMIKFKELSYLFQYSKNSFFFFLSFLKYRFVVLETSFRQVTIFFFYFNSCVYLYVYATYKDLGTEKNYVNYYLFSFYWKPFYCIIILFENKIYKSI